MSSTVCRMFVGKMPDGSWDARISRPGYDARTADVNDPAQIAFAASRAAHGKFIEAGDIPTWDTWVSFQNTYSDVPSGVFLLIVRADGIYCQPFDNTASYGAGGVTFTRQGTLYIPVVEQTRIMVTRPIYALTYTTPPSPADSFIYLIAAPP